MQMGFYFDQTRCIGCDTCVVACKDWHDVPAGPASWIRIRTIEKGKYPDLFVASLLIRCYHCLEPVCVKACPVNAISKRTQDGIVAVDRESCLGRDHCQLCLESCAYDVPQYGAEENAKMQKCNLCIERWAENKKPICVDACPMRALDAGPIEELRAKYGDCREAESFVYSAELFPSVTFKPKMDTKGRAVQRVEVAPSSGTTS
jgi:anaerobic dimethyl sulfoxide reductase subunit B (iron-sulfur subunit)